MKTKITYVHLRHPVTKVPEKYYATNGKVVSPHEIIHTNMQVTKEEAKKHMREISPKGGVCYALIFAAERVIVKKKTCHPRDNYAKAVGRKKALANFSYVEVPVQEWMALGQTNAQRVRAVESAKLSQEREFLVRVKTRPDGTTEAETWKPGNIHRVF
jgi:hypothetical protein